MNIVGMFANQLPVFFKNSKGEINGDLLTYVLLGSGVLALVVLVLFYKEENKRGNDNVVRESRRVSVTSFVEEPETNENSNSEHLGPLHITDITGLESTPTLQSLRKRRRSLPILNREDEDNLSHESLIMSDNTRTEICYSSREGSDEELVTGSETE